MSMLTRERIRTIIAGGTPDRCGFWMGYPTPETWTLYQKQLGTIADDLPSILGSEFEWHTPQWDCYRPKVPHEMFDIAHSGKVKKAHGEAGPLADVEDLSELDAFDWPDAADMDFSEHIERVKNLGDIYRAGGMWTCFYHNVMDLFGMENYFCAMYEKPEIVQAVTDRIATFYYEANDRYFSEVGDEIDGFFFGNDFGTQLDLMCSPELFDQFIMPWFRKFTDLGHAHGKQVILHSCGAISRVVDRLIDSGVNCLHPLQALAAGMDAESLAARFKGRIAFSGGIDTQHLMVHGTPQMVRDEVERIKKTLGPNLIISPSHEALLPNVPIENVFAMAEAATEREIPLPSTYRK